MRIRILPYKIASRSAKVLAQSLDVLRCNLHNTRFRPRDRDIIINWGSSYWPFDTGVVLNKPISVRFAANKITALGIMRDAEVSVIPFTLHKAEAVAWLEGGSYVYERHSIFGHGGYGIRVVHTVADLTIGTSVELYTKGIPIRREYRVHVFNGEIIDHVQKRRCLDADTNSVSEYIRNHTQGWVFVRGGFDRLTEVEEQAIKAVKALGLDFGAVDIIVEKHTGLCFVLEVNTAMGMDAGSTTLAKYTSAFNKYLNRRI